MALAVGLSPELLPAILSVNLARSAQAMAKQGRAGAPARRHRELRQHERALHGQDRHAHRGVVRVDGRVRLPRAAPPPTVLGAGAIRNAGLQSRPRQPDRRGDPAATSPRGRATEKLDEIPYDFVRKRLTRGGASSGQAPPAASPKARSSPCVAVCARLPGDEPLDDAAGAAFDERFRAWSEDGLRVLAVATGRCRRQPRYTATTSAT